MFKDYEFDFEVEDKKYHLVFNLNVMQEIQEEYKTLEKWGDLTDGKAGEVNVKALIFGLTHMMNEAIDMKNDENGTDEKFFTEKQVGRIVTKAGIEKSAKKINEAIVESTKNTKNE